jgi:hypothetical protein
LKAKHGAIGTRNLAILLVVALLITGLIGLAIFSPHLGKSNTQSTTSTESAISTTSITIPLSSAQTLNPITRLSLNLGLSTTSNDSLTVTVNEFNTLQQINNVTVGDTWPNASLFQWTRTDCDSTNLLAGYEVLQGNYGQNNFTNGTPLWLEAQISLPGCAVTLPPDKYTFMPLSDVVGNVNKPVSYSGAWSGYWTGSSGSNPGDSRGGDCPGLPPLNSYAACPLKFSPFAPGTYTVVAGDEWGQVVLLHFLVQG